MKKNKHYFAILILILCFVGINLSVEKAEAKMPMVKVTVKYQYWDSKGKAITKTLKTYKVKKGQILSLKASKFPSKTGNTRKALKKKITKGQTILVTYKRNSYKTTIKYRYYLSNGKQEIKTLKTISSAYGKKATLPASAFPSKTGNTRQSLSYAQGAKNVTKMIDYKRNTYSIALAWVLEEKETKNEKKTKKYGELFTYTNSLNYLNYEKIGVQSVSFRVTGNKKVSFSYKKKVEQSNPITPPKLTEPTNSSTPVKPTEPTNPSNPSQTVTVTFYGATGNNWITLKESEYELKQGETLILDLPEYMNEGNEKVKWVSMGSEDTPNVANFDYIKSQVEQHGKDYFSNTPVHQIKLEYNSFYGKYRDIDLHYQPRNFGVVSCNILSPTNTLSKVVTYVVQTSGSTTIPENYNIQLSGLSQVVYLPFEEAKQHYQNEDWWVLREADTITAFPVNTANLHQAIFQTYDFHSRVAKKLVIPYKKCMEEALNVINEWRIDAGLDPFETCDLLDEAMIDRLAIYDEHERESFINGIKATPHFDAPEGYVDYSQKIRFYGEVQVQGTPSFSDPYFQLFFEGKNPQFDD